MTSLGHLCRRLRWSLFPGRTGEASQEDVRLILNPSELRLWSSMQSMDRRHSVMVLERRRSISPAPDRDDEAAALLHDLGKTASRLGAWSRVLATILGPRTWRYDLYHRHESIGVEMLRTASSPTVIDLLEGRMDRRSEALRRADEI